MARLRRDTGEPPTQRSPRRLRAVGTDTYPDWDAVYRDNVDRIYGAIFAKVGNRADAEDLTAEVFLAALGPLRVSASVGEVRAYLFAAARTALAGHWRRHYGRQVTSLPEEAEAMELAAPSAATVSAAERTAEEMLADLPDQYQRVLRLRFLEGRSVRDTAAELGVSVANAKVLQHRALRRAARRGGAGDG